MPNRPRCPLISKLLTANTPQQTSTSTNTGVNRLHTGTSCPATGSSSGTGLIGRVYVDGDGSALQNCSEFIAAKLKPQRGGLITVMAQKSEMDDAWRGGRRGLCELRGALERNQQLKLDNDRRGRARRGRG